MSELKDRIHNDLTAATKSQETLRMGTLRMVLAAIRTEEVAGKAARELSDQDVITVLNRESKKRKEAAVAYDEASRPELAAREREELEIIAGYLPAAMSREDVDAVIAAAIAQAAADGKSGPSAMGAVMKLVTSQVAGRFDGGEVAAAVKAALA